jgi:hypothetical protein
MAADRFNKWMTRLQALIGIGCFLLFLILIFGRP